MYDSHDLTFDLVKEKEKQESEFEENEEQYGKDVAHRYIYIYI